MKKMFFLSIFVYGFMIPIQIYAMDIDGDEKVPLIADRSVREETGDTPSCPDETDAMRDINKDASTQHDFAPSQKIGLQGNAFVCSPSDEEAGGVCCCCYGKYKKKYDCGAVCLKRKCMCTRLFMITTGCWLTVITLFGVLSYITIPRCLGE